MTQDRETAPATSPTQPARVEVSDLALADYRYQSEPTAGLASVQTAALSKTAMPSTLLANIVWR